MGDPAGIGPEICRKVLRSSLLQKKCELVLVGDLDLARKIAKGKPSAVAGRASGEYIQRAVEMTVKGVTQAIVTAPINKKSFLMGGWGKKYKGHTEMLAGLTQSSDVALMLVSGHLRAVHVTSHIALKEVAKNITTNRVQKTIQLAHRALQGLGIKKPRIGVSALNPHGGDDGIMGLEEQRTIRPAIEEEQKSGRDVTGPYSSDVLWPLVDSCKLDVGVAMYHDQGQIAVKLKGFGVDKKGRLAPGGVNITLGLPLVRTSPAHGSAYDIAGKGVASEKSLLEAIDVAIDMVKNRG